MPRAHIAALAAIRLGSQRGLRRLGPFRSSGRTLFFVPSKWAIATAAHDPAPTDALLSSTSAAPGRVLSPRWEALYELTVLSPSSSASA